MTELYKALLRARKTINAPAKNRKAMYGKYADLEAVLEAVTMPLMREGIIINQHGVVSDSGPAIMRTTLTHVESGQQIHSDIPLLSVKQNDPQALGGSITYARRYGITALLSIVADDDDDGNTASGRNSDGSARKQQESSKPKVTQEEITSTLSVENPLPEKMVNALFIEFQRAGFDKDSEVVSEIKALIKRDFGQVAALTEGEAKAAVGHARKVKAGETKRLT